MPELRRTATVTRTVMVILAVGLAGSSCRPTRGPDDPSVAPRAPSADVPSGPSAALVEQRQAAATGVTDATLAALLTDHWDARLREYPVAATRQGVHDYDDRLADQSEEGRERRRVATAELLRRARALDLATLSASDRETLELFVADLTGDQTLEVCRGHEWNIGVHHNPVSHAVKLHDGFVLSDPADGDNLTARYRAVGTLIDQRIASLSRGVADGLVANRQTLSRLVDLVERQLAQPVDEWGMLEPLQRMPTWWTAEQREHFERELTAAVQDHVRPAFERYRDHVVQRLMPKARGVDAPGIGALPLGKACYAAQIHTHTTLPLAAEEVHRIGLEEIARLDAEIAALGAQALGTTSLADTLDRLRSDRSLYFGDAEQVERAAVDSLAAAKAAMPRFFGIQPKADCVVRRVPAFEAPNTHIGYYEAPHADGSKPGEYYVNVYAPATRPRFEARVLAVHESIPGHHLQTAIAQERGQLPAFRRNSGYSAFVEGWALYTERLADEMGLYGDDLDRMGMLSFDAWRAGRLVVDTGVHAMGWTRAQAEAFLLAHTALTPENISNEVDRYIGWPGQALSYKIGQREIWALRREAETALADRFVLAEFHDVVLGAGSVPLDVLRRRVRAWVAAAD